MNKRLLCILLAVCSLVCSFGSFANARMTRQERAAQKLVKKQQKQMNKYYKQQRKAEKKQQKQWKKKAQREHRHVLTGFGS